MSKLLAYMKTFPWVVIAFIAANLFVPGVIIWQLRETRPERWCAVANVNDISAEGCFRLLLGLIEIKDHTIIGLLFILGVSIISIVAVTLKVRIDADGPGGTSLDIGRNHNDTE